MGRPKKVKEVENIEVDISEDVKEVNETSTLNGEFFYDTNGIRYKKIFKDGVIVERVRV